MRSFDDLSLFKVVELCQKDIFCRLDIEEIAGFKENLINAIECNRGAKALIESTGALFSHILPGRIDDIATLPHSESPQYLAAQALYYLYQKNYLKSVAAFNKMITTEVSRCVIMDNSLYSLLYVKALSSDKRQSSSNKLAKIIKYMLSNHAAYQTATQIYLAFYCDRDCSKYIKFINESWLWLHPIDLALAVMVVRHYNIGELNSQAVQRAESIIDHDEFLLLQLEASGSMPKYIEQRDKLKNRLKLESIFEPFDVVESWQKSLNELSDILSVSSPKGRSTSQAQSESRIVYLIDRDDNVYPRLQKSKNGTTWSKGRSVALSSFNNHQCEGMVDVDRCVAACVKSYESWRGGRVYTLKGVKVFKALINHPLVFCDSNPDISISIIGDVPYIRVESYDGGYRVTSNIKKLESSNTVITKESDVLYRIIELTSLQRRIIELFHEQSQYPASAKEQLSQLIVHIAPSITVHSDITAQSENLKNVKGSSRITVQLIPISDGLKAELFVKPLEDAGQYCKANDGQDSFIAQHNGESVVVKRNLKKERANFVVVQEVLRDTTGDNAIDDTVYFDDIYESLSLIEKLHELDKIARVEWPKGAKLKILGSVDFDKLNLSLRSGSGWFEVDGDVKVDKMLLITIAEMLERNRGSKGRFIELTKGEYIALSEDLHRRLNALDANLSQGKKKLQLSQFSSGVITDMERDGVKVRKDAAFETLQSRIDAAENREIIIPSTLQAELRDYQVDGYKWMSRLAAWGAGACLADDMGLGKTVQSIALLLDRAEQGASLIVAPASVVNNWRNELQKFSPSLNCMMLHDNISEREATILSSGAFDVVVTTYGLLSRIEDIITTKAWNVILLDEAHNIKNRDSKSSKVAMNLKGDFRVVLTGTPIQNHLGEIWNLFNFTNPGLLGGFEHFSTKFITPIEQSGDKLRQRELKRILQPFMLRRTKSEVLDELPTKTEMIHHIELSAEETALYENIRIKALNGLESGDLNPIQSLAEITKLRQAACHPSLINNALGLSSSKVIRFTELVTELITNRHRALVFSQFTSFLSLVKEALTAKGIPFLYLDGSTPIKERDKLVQSFQQGDSPLFLISLKAGGTGLNLTAADYVIHLDPWWNPAIEDQASDRSHRIGQTRPVTIYRLISKDTIEEKIIELHKSKRSLADSLLEGSNLSHKLSREDMLALLRGYDTSDKTR
ncbi:MAG: DEAD/DEAH box helicase [Rikenellaceae bacterium]